MTWYFVRGLSLTNIVFTASYGDYSVSGVDLCTETTGYYYGFMTAPLDSTKRYDDDNDFQIETAHFVRGRLFSRYSFMCHAACWGLLKEAFKPNDVPLPRLMEVFDSLPRRYYILLDCGHTYGGLCSHHFKAFSPWKHTLNLRPSSSEARQHAAANPWDVPEVHRLLEATSNHPEYQTQFPLSYPSCDCFAALPLEIRQLIAQYLPGRDVFALCESSRSFLPLLQAPTFWAKRFYPGEERGFFFEKYKAAEVRDWLSLYRMTGEKQCPPGLKNRMRIWQSIEHIVELLSLRLATDHDMTTLSSVPQPVSLGKFLDDTYWACKADCEVLSKQCASIPEDLVGIALSFVKTGSCEHLWSIFQVKWWSRNSTGLHLSNTHNALRCPKYLWVCYCDVSSRNSSTPIRSEEWG